MNIEAEICRFVQNVPLTSGHKIWYTISILIQLYGGCRMKEYEITVKFCNACAGSSRPQTFFEEAELEYTDDFVRMKHGKDFRLLC